MRATRIPTAAPPADELTALRHGHVSAPTTRPFAPGPAAPRAFDPLREYLKPRTSPAPRATLNAPTPPDPSRYLPRPAPSGSSSGRGAGVGPVAAPAPRDTTARPRGPHCSARRSSENGVIGHDHQGERSCSSTLNFGFRGLRSSPRQAAPITPRRSARCLVAEPDEPGPGGRRRRGAGRPERRRDENLRLPARGVRRRGSQRPRRAERPHGLAADLVLDPLGNKLRPAVPLGHADEAIGRGRRARRH